jgi:hypothetical protein
MGKVFNCVITNSPYLESRRQINNRSTLLYFSSTFIKKYKNLQVVALQISQVITHGRFREDGVILCVFLFQQK